ncbi:extracellular solute-binding protein [Paludicola sp. MB14-C6]|uniref:extracellular solute-binding protein n=1 Tax=Paludihabitans sp. MB14-C6 TaxID=3070656 RepID=UPI0027DAD35F|nr:extracellular solute-binding protein [Paludicola sp. MB14-C6]WMJ23082.1 extracellular solute-binding protein [Paludicola sp. MB14-C6]
MKKSLSILMAIILVMSVFTGCNKDKKTNTVSKVELTTEYENSTELVGDPNATGELKIAYYYPEYKDYNDQLKTAVAKYKKLYPNVLVNVNRPETGSKPNYEIYNDYRNNLDNLLDSSSGTDVVFFRNNIDIKKLIDKELLFDLTDLMNNDPIPNMDQLNSSVIYSSQLNQKQYFMPLGYFMSVLMTTEQIQKEQQFKLTECKDYTSIAELISSIIAKGTSSQAQLTGYISFPKFFPWISDIDCCNAEQLHNCLVNDETKKAFEQYKTSFFSFETMDTEKYNNLYTLFPENLNSKRLYIGEINNGLNDLLNTYKIVETGSKPIVAPWRKNNESIQAFWNYGVGISNKSKNKTNAYNFIKVLLSNEIQICPEFEGQLYYYPISNEAICKYLKNQLLSKDLLFGKENKKDSRTEFINELISLISQTDASGITLDYLEIISNAMQPYFKGTKSYEECIKDVESKIQAYVLK